MIGRREEGREVIWAVRFWFGEFHEQCVYTIHRSKESARERERGKRERHTQKERERLNSREEVF